jgi:hypothetical protein
MESATQPARAGRVDEKLHCSLIPLLAARPRGSSTASATPLRPLLCPLSRAARGERLTTNVAWALEWSAVVADRAGLVTAVPPEGPRRDRRDVPSNGLG